MYQIQYKVVFIVIFIFQLHYLELYIASSKIIVSKSKATKVLIIETKLGKIVGHEKKSRQLKSFYAFKGIPYGIVQKRFQSASPVQKWNETLNGDKFGPSCPQAKTGRNYDENCLFLNVYVPKTGSTKKAVMFFIHGGALIHGSGSFETPHYFMDEDIVLVTINYRLGAFGFLSLQNTQSAPGNLGLKDSLLALKWVNENIEDFGGDKNKVTIMGQSSGGVIGSLLLFSPSAKGLFHGLIAQSLTILNIVWRHKEKNEKFAFKLGKKLNCTHQNITDEFINCLVSKKTSEILHAQSRLKKWYRDPFIPFTPIIEDNDDAFISEDPRILLKEGRFNKVPVILTVNNREGLLLHAASLAIKRKKLNELDLNWTRVAPITLMFEHDPHINYNNKSSNEKRNFLSKLRNFYFGKEKLLSYNEKTLNRLTRFYSDRKYIHGVKNTALELSKFVPVYIGIFTRPGQKSTADYLNFVKINGVAHSDELQFFFKNFGKGYFKLSKSLSSYSKNLVSIWASFSIKGVPELVFNKSNKNYSTLWPKVAEKERETGKLKWLDLGVVDKKLKILKNPFRDRLDFWDKFIKTYAQT